MFTPIIHTPVSLFRTPSYHNTAQPVHYQHTINHSEIMANTAENMVPVSEVIKTNPLTGELMYAKLFRTEYFTHRDKKTNVIDKQIACQVWLFDDWSYRLVFVTIV